MPVLFHFNALRSLLIISLLFISQSMLMAQGPGDAYIAPPALKLKHIDCKNAISTNTTGIALQRGDLSYERAIANDFSLCATVEFGIYNSGQGTSGSTMGGGSVYERYKLSGVGFLVEGRYYPIEKRKLAPRGFFTGVYYKQTFLRETFESHSVTTVDDNYQAGGIGLDVGYKLGKKHFMFEPLIGYAINWNNGVGSNPKLDPFYAEDMMWTVFIRVEGRIGFVF